MNYDLYDPKLEARRFWSKVLVGDGCWEWQGSQDNHGYGHLTWHAHNIKAHRLAWYMKHGYWPPRGMHLDHLCKNPLCVRPSHLENVTHKENLRRSLRTHCIHGHPFSGDNLKLWTGRRRWCHACAKEVNKRASKAYREKKRGR